jgi:hypothetical protein
MYVVLSIRQYPLYRSEKWTYRRRFLRVLYYTTFDADFGRLIGCPYAKFRHNTDCITNMLGHLMPWTDTVNIRVCYNFLCLSPVIHGVISTYYVPRATAWHLPQGCGLALVGRGCGPVYFGRASGPVLGSQVCGASLLHGTHVTFAPRF